MLDSVMGLHRSDIPGNVAALIQRGTVIPAHPLALNAAREIDRVRQRALTRYYLDSGVGGLAIGVHTTQFAIREAGLYAPVLDLGAATVDEWAGRPVAMIAGLCGPTEQAVTESQTAVLLGYHAGLLSLAAMNGASEDELIDHCALVANEIPLVGFYLQPAVGGVVLSSTFWRRFAMIDNVIAIKVAPFNRYRTLDVVRGVIETGAEDRIAIYTGNDDHIVLDLLTPFVSARLDQQGALRMRGGLLGHWSVWTKRAVELLERIHAAVAAGHVDQNLQAMDSKVTDCNRAIFDVANDFAGCIAGCHEILRRQGLLEGIWCLDPDEGLSPGQLEEIDRIYAGYPEMNDDDFVRQNLNRWLS